MVPASTRLSQTYVAGLLAFEVSPNSAWQFQRFAGMCPGKQAVTAAPFYLIQKHCKRLSTFQGALFVETLKINFPLVSGPEQAVLLPSN